MSIERDVGLLQGELKSLQGEMAEAKIWLREISTKQDATNLMIAEAFASGKGTWKTLAFLGSLAVTLGGLTGWVIHYFKITP